MESKQTPTCNQAQAAYTPATLFPPDTHPRLLINAEELSRIQREAKIGTNRRAYDEWQRLLSISTQGHLSPPEPGRANYDPLLLAVIEAYALEYALSGTVEYGLSAIASIQRYAAQCTYEGIHDYSRPMGHVIFTAAEVYDWCYPLLTPADKESIIALCEQIAAGMEIGYPPTRQGAVAGHAGEAQLLRDLLSFSIAVYDERPDIYEGCAGRLFKEFVATRNYWYPSHTQHQGCDYGSYRYVWDIWSAWIIRRLRGVSIYIPDMGQVPYFWLYLRRPDGQLLRDGDSYQETQVPHGQWWKNDRLAFFYAACYYQNPHFLYEYERQSRGMDPFSYDNSTITPVQFLVFNDPALRAEPYDGLPTSRYFASPNGMILARTGWTLEKDSADVLALMKFGERWASNHNHLDAGNFQLYYKGILASESGCYDRYGSLQDGNYNKKSVAHNTILLFDPQEEITGYAPRLNDGGQRFPLGSREPPTMADWMDAAYERSCVLHHCVKAIGTETELAYLKGDMTAAYTKKAAAVVRAMLFLPLAKNDGSTAPKALFFTFDTVQATPGVEPPRWLLHMQQAPEIENNRITIRRDANGYGGRLVCDTLLPHAARLEAIGGPDRAFMVNGQNLPLENPDSMADALEAGWGRVEVSPTEPGETTEFLHALCVTEAASAYEPAWKAVETPDLAGACLEGWCVLFVREHAAEKTAFALPETDGSRIVLSGLTPGSWTVGGETYPVIAEEGLLVLPAQSAPGRVTKA